MLNNEEKLKKLDSFFYKELAIGSVENRGNIVTKAQVKEYYGRKDIYFSYFDFNEDGKAYCFTEIKSEKTTKNKRSMRGYAGIVSADSLFIDIDCENHLNEAIQVTREMLDELKKYYYLEPDEIKIYFSGNKGFHLELPGYLFGYFAPSENLPQIHKGIVQELSKGIVKNYKDLRDEIGKEILDFSIYKTTGLFRIPTTINSKSGLYKVEISPSELYSLGIDEIKELAKTNRLPEDIKRTESENIKLMSLYQKIKSSASSAPAKDSANTKKDKKAVKAANEEIKWKNIKEYCKWVKDIYNRAVFNNENLTHAERVAFAKIYLKFGDKGREFIHEVLSELENYDEVKTNYMLDSLDKENEPSSACSILCPNGICSFMKALNRKSPTAFAYLHKAEDYDETWVTDQFRKYQDKLIYSLKEDEFYIYEGGVYKLTLEGELLSLINSFMKLALFSGEISASKIKNVLERLKMTDEIHYKGEFNKEPGIVNLKNGLFNLSKVEFLEHSPAHFATLQLGFSYEADAKAPKFRKFLDEIFNADEEKIEFILNTMCYLLIPDYSFQKIFILYGSGRNGKSVLTSVIEEMVGRENTTGVSIHDLAGNRFALINLKDKLVNISSEIGSKSLETEMLKKLSGGDLITADRKWKDSLSFKNVARLIINANQLPRFSELNDAILERFELIRFPRTFRNEDVNTNLINELRDELPGIFNMVASKYPSIIKDGAVRYLIPEVVEKDKIILLGEISSASEFVNDCCTLDPKLKISLQSLFEMFLQFCKDRNYKAIGYRGFKKALTEGYQLSTKKEQHGLVVQGISSSYKLNLVLPERFQAAFN